MSVAVIPMAKELGWSAMERGLVSSAFFWGYALTQIPAGWVSTRCAAADGPCLCCCCRRRTLLRLLLLMAPASAAPVIWARRAFLSAAASFLTPACPPCPAPCPPACPAAASAARGCCSLAWRCGLWAPWWRPPQPSLDWLPCVPRACLWAWERAWHPAQPQTSWHASSQSEGTFQLQQQEPACRRRQLVAAGAGAAPPRASRRLL
jgi:hypothetical protein